MIDSVLTCRAAMNGIDTVLDTHPMAEILFEKSRKAFSSTESIDKTEELFGKD